MDQPVTDIRTLQKANEAIRIFRTAVAKVQEENRQRGIPNVYSINGVLHYEFPDGTLTTETPEVYRTQPAEARP